ncbi:MAG TPA: glycosyltransferase family 4 protein [Gaiellaceae bacterium]|nr:glycosyltransferase family 4 protein [Gaiellaceae bacterium]
MHRSRLSRFAHAHLPAPVVETLRRARAGVFWSRVALRELPRWNALRRAPVPREGAHVYYGSDRMSGPGDVVVGGAVKFARLAEVFPNEPRGWNLLYLGSSSLPVDSRALLAVAKARGARFVLNQDGVRYPGLGAPDMERGNRRDAQLLHAADHVFFQSAFCREAVDRFYGPPRRGCEILHNAVDTGTFLPAPERRPADLTLLLGGSQYQRYRVEAALRTLAIVADARLVVTGSLSFDRPERARAFVLGLAEDLGIRDRLELVGPYAQKDAPALLQRAHVLLHTKYNDPCPGIVIEAMACGVPVVYSASGGVPELVGDEAGVGVPAPHDFQHDHPPAPEDLAAAVHDVVSRLDELSLAARARAVARFDIGPWIERHRVVFAELLS